jgi:hypothetical protein
MTYVEELEEVARGRFVRWDAALWRSFLAGPADRFSQTLAAAAGDNEGKAQLFRSYLRLACEAIGLGYLFPGESGSENVFSLAWNTLIPRLLPEVAPARRSEVLAQCWNLGENLEQSPLWVRRIFYRTTRSLTRLDELESLVQRVSREAFDPPTTRLDQVRRLTWVHLGAEDKRFLPGAIHYLAPRVICVHDRERTGGGGRDPVSYGLWLTDAPSFLGPMGCKDASRSTQLERSLVNAGTRLDARLDETFAGAFNEHSAVTSLVTSQFVVALLP